MPGVNDCLVVFLHGVGASGADLARLAEPLSAFLPTAAFAAPDAPGRFDGGGPGRQWFSVAGISADNRQQRVGEARAAFDRVVSAALAERGFSGRLDRVAMFGFSQGAIMALDARRQRPLAGRRGRRLFRPVARRSRSASRRCGDAGAAAARRGRCDRPRGGKPPRRDAAEGGGFRGRSARLRAARPFDFRRRRRSGGDLPRPRAEAGLNERKRRCPNSPPRSPTCRRRRACRRCSSATAIRCSRSRTANTAAPGARSASRCPPRARSWSSRRTG